MIRIDNILVPVDFSDHSREAMDQAIGLAKTFSSKVHLVHVLHFPALVAAPEPAVVPAGLWQDIRDGSARKLQEAAQTVAAEGITVETHLREGASAQEIVEAAGELEADLIVMGTRGLSGLKHVLLGYQLRHL